MANTPSAPGMRSVMPYRAMSNFALPGRQHVKAGSVLEMDPQSDATKRLVNIGRIVPCVEGADRQAPKVAEQTELSLPEDTVKLVEDTLQGKWSTVMPALREQPVEALKLALNLEHQKKNPRVRLIAQLQSAIEQREG